MTFSPDGTTAYVTNFESASISIIDTANHTQTGLVADYTGRTAWSLELAPGGSVAYVADPQGNSVFVLDTTQNKQAGTIASYTGNAPWHIAFSPDGTLAYVTNYGSDSVSIINATAGIQTGTVTNYTGNTPWDLTFSPDGTTVYVANSGSNSVSVIEVNSGTQTGVVAHYTGLSPVTIVPLGDTAYVTNAYSNSVSVLRLPTPPILNPAQPTEGTVGSPYVGFTFATTGFPTPATAFAPNTNTEATSPGNASVPSGLNVNTAGVLSGTISSTAQPGTYSFSVVASNGVVPDATQEYSLTVVAPPKPAAPVINTAGELANTGSTDYTPTPLAGLLIALGVIATLAREWNKSNTIKCASLTN
ncbi:YncE family protein [Lysinibacter sp. HNR]|uniref:YncE family protein n=1 Tax=Lysinibacter sp. HNR TaxID=3031408 RepID=UPI002434E44A|nr:YncE family protein [Lysinibacter sp. HNR]WGD37622.1 YncE family protein [Lysinibacter sp. HNR]